MESSELPDDLKPYRQAIEALDWNRFIPRYLKATPKQQLGMRKAIWHFTQSIEETAAELEISFEAAAKLVRDVMRPDAPSN